MSITEKTGKVVAAIAVHEDDELMLITSKGQNVRIRVGGDKAIRETGRVAQGVKLMDLKKDEVIQDVTTVISDAEEEELVEEMGSGISIVEQGVEPEDGSIVDEGTRSEEESS
jgi:DNA gyrase subunit A